MNETLQMIPPRVRVFWRTLGGRYSLYGALLGLGIAAGVLALRFIASDHFRIQKFLQLALSPFGGYFLYETLAAIVVFLLVGGWIGRRIDRMQKRSDGFENVSRGLRFLSRTDGLTGVLSRQTLMERLEEEIRRARRYGTPLACLFIDVDEFKRLNDDHGHLFGDRSLTAIARSMGRHIRETDVLGRYGGDEFLILMPQAGLEHAYSVTERVRKGVASLEFVEGTKGKLTVSIGLFV